MSLKKELGQGGSRAMNSFAQQTTLLKEGSLEREDLEAFTRVLTESNIGVAVKDGLKRIEARDKRVLNVILLATQCDVLYHVVYVRADAEEET
ncbi:hypothetical protein CFP56_041194 [Quercus suber]|uniref:Uncharacterized protein n=1 Tax=Quercus suber TaxID=58331 RepID=A0AAW0IVX1_QUESU